MTKKIAINRPSGQHIDGLDALVEAAAAGRQAWLLSLLKSRGFIQPNQLAGKDLADIFSISPQAVSKWAAEGCPRRGKFYNLAEVITWKILKARQIAGDLMAAGGDSPHLERYRSASADLREMEVEERRGALVRLDDTKEFLGRLAKIIRSLGASLGKAYGPDAQQMLNEHLEDLNAVIEKNAEGGSMA